MIFTSRAQEIEGGVLLALVKIVIFFFLSDLHAILLCMIVLTEVSSVLHELIEGKKFTQSNVK
jgi:hypothetical protein